MGWDQKEGLVASELQAASSLGDACLGIWGQE